MIFSRHRPTPNDSRARRGHSIASCALGMIALFGRAGVAAGVAANSSSVAPIFNPTLAPAPARVPAPAPDRSSASALAPFAPVPAPAPAPAPYGSLRVNGTQLVNELGEVVRLRSINLSSLDWGRGDPAPDDVPPPCWANQTIVDSLSYALDAWKVKFIRLPVNPQMWTAADASAMQSYRTTVDTIVERTTRRGAYIDLDMHGSMMNDGLNTYSMPDPATVDVTVDIARR